MGFSIDQNKLKRNRVLCTKPTNLRLNRNMRCRAPCITEILSNGSWKGKTCFLIGGGPSLEDFDFRPLKNELTIGVNKSFTRFPTTINFAMDDRLYNLVSGTGKSCVMKAEGEELHQQWLAYKGIKLFVRRSVKSKYDSSVYVIPSLDAKVISFDLSRGIWAGNNSGFGALMLAIALGATRIGLLGYSMKVQGIGKKIKTHWHGGYPFGSNPEHFQRKLDKFRMCFEEFASPIAQQGITVVNLNSDSALECFQKEDLKTFLTSHESEFMGTK